MMKVTMDEIDDHSRRHTKTGSGVHSGFVTASIALVIDVFLMIDEICFRKITIGTEDIDVDEVVQELLHVITWMVTVDGCFCVLFIVFGLGTKFGTKELECKQMSKENRWQDAGRRVERLGNGNFKYLSNITGGTMKSVSHLNDVVDDSLDTIATTLGVDNELWHLITIVGILGIADIDECSHFACVSY